MFANLHDSVIMDSWGPLKSVAAQCYASCHGPVRAYSCHGPRLRVRNANLLKKSR